MKHRRHIYLLGFSLVELMAVLAVVGILVSLALPRFRVFVARGRQAEAINNLGVIDKLQRAYHLREQGFGRDGQWHSGLNMGQGATGGLCGGSSEKNDLGFRVEDCTKLRYTYVTSGATSNANNSGLAGKYIYPDCSGEDDEWGIRHDPSGGADKLQHNKDAVKECEN